MTTNDDKLVHHICRVFAYRPSPKLHTKTHVQTALDPNNPHGTIKTYYTTLEGLLQRDVPPNINNITASCFMHHLTTMASHDEAAWNDCIKRVTHRLYFPDEASHLYLYDTAEGMSIIANIAKADVRKYTSDFSPIIEDTVNKHVLTMALLHPGLVTSHYFKVLHQPTSTLSPSASENTLWHYMCDRQQAIRGKAQKRLLEILTGIKTDKGVDDDARLMSRVVLEMIFHQ